MDSSELKGKKDLVEVMASFQHGSLGLSLNSIIVAAESYIRTGDEDYCREAYGIYSDLLQHYGRVKEISIEFINRLEPVIHIEKLLRRFGEYLHTAIDEQNTDYLFLLRYFRGVMNGLDTVFMGLLEQGRKDIHLAEHPHKAMQFPTNVVSLDKFKNMRGKE